MTRIRKINVSQVEGGGADNTNTDQIRPSGETAFYIDNNNKLTLMMFDGVRTHRDSKVLSPGVLYGSNADAGDESGSDTIKLIPDASLGTDQYIVVDPTGGEPGHIHLRAGGTQDSSTADLYLGGELTNVRVSDTTDNVRIRTTLVGEGETNYDWTFDNAGNITLPNNAVIRTDGSNVEIGGVANFNVEAAGVVNIYTDTSGETPYQWQFGDDGSLTLPDNGVVNASGPDGLTLGGNYDVKIISDYTDNNRTWTFSGTTGSITFPDSTVQETAWAGGRVVAVPTASTGAEGNQQGDLAFTSGHLYYCIADFDTHETPITVNSTEWGGTAGPLTTLPFFSVRTPQIGWTIDITFNSGPATLTITLVTPLGDDRYQVDFGSVGNINASNGNAGTLTDNLPVVDIWKRSAWSADTW